MKPKSRSLTQHHDCEEFLWSTADVGRFAGSSERQLHILCCHRQASTSELKTGLEDQRPGIKANERARQLAAIAASGDEDAAECAAADLAREFPRP